VFFVCLFVCLFLKEETANDRQTLFLFLFLFQFLELVSGGFHFRLVCSSRGFFIALDEDKYLTEVLILGGLGF